MTTYYPISVDLSKKRVLVVGGGKVALRKVETLLEYGADVTVVSPEVAPELQRLGDEGKIITRKRIYESSDMNGISIVIAATDSREINTRVSQDAQAARALCNVVDVPDLCDFIVPATVKRGDMVISISTGGRSPMLARRIREQLDRQFGEEYDQYVELLGEMRDSIRDRYPTQEERQAAIRKLLDVEILDLLREGRLEEARKRALSCIW